MGTNDDDWEVTSQVDSPPEPPPRRMSAVPDRDVGKATARAALAKIDHLGRRFDEHSKSDNEQLEKISKKIDKHGETLTELQVSMAKVETTLTTLMSDRASDRERERIQLVASTEVKRHMTEADAGEFRVQQDHKRKSWITLAGQIGAPMAAVISGVIALVMAGKC